MNTTMGSFRRWVSIVLVCVLSFSLLTVAQGAAATSDDMEGHWAEKNLRDWVAKGLLKGYDDGTYKPDRVVTRAEFAALINRAFKLEEKAPIAFADVTSSSWAYEVVQVAFAKGYINGYPDGSFRLNQAVTREQAAIMAARLLQLEHESLAALEQFSDALKLSETGQAAVAALLQEQLIQGLPDGSFGPQKGLTRAQAVTLLQGALEFANQTTVYDEAGTYGDIEDNTTIHGNVVIAAPGITLQNVVITGNLTVTAAVGEGDAYFRGVRVEGDTIIQGGGANSIHFEDSVLVRITVDKNDGSVRVVVAGATSVQHVLVKSPVKLEESFVTDTGIANVDLEESLPVGSQVELIGHFETVNVMSSNVKVNIPSGSLSTLNVQSSAQGNEITVHKEAAILKLVLDAVTELLGEGKVETAVINKGAENSNFETKPTQVEGEGAVAPTPTIPPAPPIVNPGPVATPTPTVTPNPTPTPCTGTVGECEDASLKGITFGEYTLSQVDNNDLLTGVEGFNPEVFKYSIINDLDEPTLIEFSVEKPELATVGFSVSTNDGSKKTYQYYSGPENGTVLLTFEPGHDVRIGISVRSGDGKRSKYYDVIFHKRRTIQESFKITLSEGYNLTSETWDYEYLLVSGFVNGERLQSDDAIAIYNSSDVDTRTLISSGTNRVVRIPKTALTETKGTLFITITRGEEIFAEGEYSYDITPINRIENVDGIEARPLTRQGLIDVFLAESFLDTPLKAGARIYLNNAELQAELPEAAYYTLNSEWVSYPRTSYPPTLVMEQVKQGIVPEGFSSLRSEFNSIYELYSGPAPVEGERELGGSYYHVNSDENAPKEVHDLIYYLVLFDRDMNVLGYILEPVVFDEEHVAEGYTPVGTWQVDESNS